MIHARRTGPRSVTSSHRGHARNSGQRKTSQVRARRRPARRTIERSVPTMGVGDKAPRWLPGGWQSAGVSIWAGRDGSTEADATTPLIRERPSRARCRHCCRSAFPGRHGEHGVRLSTHRALHDRMPPQAAQPHEWIVDAVAPVAVSVVITDPRSHNATGTRPLLAAWRYSVAVPNFSGGRVVAICGRVCSVIQSAHGRQM